MTQVCSVYSQLLQLFSRGQFAQAVKQHQAEFNAKGFTCWEQFVAMLFCQVAHLNSLREVCMGLAGCESPLKHLGISTAPKKSTLAYANAHRPWELYELQGTLGRGTFLQGAEANRQSKVVPGHQRQCGQDADLDRFDRHAHFEVPADEVQLWLVALQSCGSAAPATVYLQGLVGVAQPSAGRASRRKATGRAVTHAAGLVAMSWTAEQMQATT